MDFAGNIERHRDWDNTILHKAVLQTLDKDKPFVIQCTSCMTMNTEHARRCVGLPQDARCDYYFEFKECPNLECRVKNDISARHCRLCETEIIDPNKKLSLESVKPIAVEVFVNQARFGISGTQKSFRIDCGYQCHDKEGNIRMVMEHYTPCTEKARHVFYGQFVRKHCDKASSYFIYLNNRQKVEEMLREAKIPRRLLITEENKNIKIKKKLFD